MKIPSKRILHDENGQPVETRMNYEEFCRFEKAMEASEVLGAYERMMSAFGTVKWGEDPVAYQRRLRDEWD